LIYEYLVDADCCGRAFMFSCIPSERRRMKEVIDARVVTYESGSKVIEIAISDHTFLVKLQQGMSRYEVANRLQSVAAKIRGDIK